MTASRRAGETRRQLSARAEVAGALIEAAERSDLLTRRIADLRGRPMRAAPDIGREILVGRLGLAALDALLRTSHEQLRFLTATADAMAPGSDAARRARRALNTATERTTKAVAAVERCRHHVRELHEQGGTRRVSDSAAARVASVVREAVLPARLDVRLATQALYREADLIGATAHATTPVEASSRTRAALGRSALSTPGSPKPPLFVPPPSPPPESTSARSTSRSAL